MPECGWTMRTVFSVCLLSALAGLPGCGKSKAVLHVYNWADYVKPELVKRFETENHCTVVLDTYDSNENLFAKLQAGATGYDLAFPSSYMLQIMREQDMLIPLDHALLPNLKHLDPSSFLVSQDTGAEFSVPYTVSYTGVAYLKSKVTNVVESWSMFDRQDLAGRMTMLNDMRETIGGALKYLGHSSNSTNGRGLSEARGVVLRWKKNLAKFENEQYKPGLASGEFLLVHGYVGDLLQIQAKNPDIVIFLPREGYITTCDCMVIPIGAQNVELAHKYINFMLDPQIAAENTAFTQYLCPNKDSYPLLAENIRNNPAILVPESLKSVAEVNRDLGADNAAYVKTWDEIKAGQ